MAQRKLLTPMVVSRIRQLIQQGLSADQIAQRVGCTVGTLRVRCSQLKISLRRVSSADVAGQSQRAARAATGGASVKRRAESRADKFYSTFSIDGPLVVNVSAAAVRQLQDKAAVKGVSDSRLAAALLERIAQDDLYDAVLDE